MSEIAFQHPKLGLSGVLKSKVASVEIRSATEVKVKMRSSVVLSGRFAKLFSKGLVKLLS